MKAITIQQPYAHLIALPDDDDRAKRVENRTWATPHRGPLAIHAGKGRDYLDLSEDGLRDESYDLPLSDMAFGSIVAVAELRACVKVEQMRDPHTGRFLRGLVEPWALRQWPWLEGHEHVEGPIAWVLCDVRPLAKPIPCPGRQQLWGVPPVILEQLKAML